MMPPVRSLLFTCSVMALACASPSLSYANPQDGVVTSGAATIVSNGSKLDIHQSTDKAVIDWRGFDIGSGEETEFHQLSSNSIALNRVNSNSPSSINGKLSANGNVVIINQNGVMFGAGSQVDVNGLVVSTADITNENFMNGTMKFDKAGNNPNAKIVNAGTITAKDAGLVGFVAPQVENSGVIVANLGRVHLASGDTATVDFYGDGLMEVQASDQLTQQIVKNTGTISANGGKVALTAAAGRDIVNSLIQVDGIIHAQSVGVHNGEIIIGAAGSNKTSKQGKSKVVINGTLDASGKQTGQTGGKITVTGDEVTLSSTARLDASGHNGGGSIKLGGDYQGSGTTQTAKTLTVDSGSLITNDAIETGTGGTTILWSDGDTVFRGLITARGGSISGNGGFAEVSGKGTLLYDGLVDLRADNGDFGNLLLDPTDITISNAASSNTTGTTSITGTAATSNINVTTLQNQLATAAVTISTTSAYGGNGDITVVDALSWSSSRSLTLTADRDILINAAITIAFGNNAGFTATAGRDIAFNANVTTAGNGTITALAGRNLSVAGGVTLTNGSSGSLSLRAANGVVTNTGLLNIEGTLNAGTGTVTLLSGLDTSSNRGDLTLNNTNFLMSGAAIGSSIITGFRDVTISRNLISGGYINIAAYRNLTINSGATIQTFNTSSPLVLTAANNTTTGLGVLTLNGILNVGTSTLTLTSGVDGSGNRADLTLDNSNFLMQGATVGTTTISGFNDIFLNRNLTFSAAATITANRHLTVGSGATITSGSTTGLSLLAANNVSTGVGIFTNNGAISIGTGTLTLVSGVDGAGARTDLSLNSTNFLLQGATISAPVLTGFRDINFNRSIAFSNATTITANRNLTIGTGATISSGAATALNLRAANNVSTGLGIFTLNGAINAGTSTLALVSGVDGSGNRADLTLDITNFLMQGATVGAPTLTGFRDITFNRDIISSDNVSITAFRNLTVGNGVTIKTGAAMTLGLQAANGVTTSTGLLTLNGILNVGTNAFTLTSGVDSSGNRSDLTLTNSNLLMQGATTSAVAISGFNDITLNRNITSSNHVSMTAYRNLTVSAGTTITSGPTGGYNVALRAAGNVITGVGLLTINGIINIGTGTLTLLSGVDSSGNRGDLTLDSTNYMQGAIINGAGITGFRDITINTAMTSNNANIAITAERNLNIGSSAVFQTNNGYTVALKAAGGNINNIGLLTYNGKINLTQNSVLSLVSGQDASGNRADLTIDNTNYVMLGTTTSPVGFSGFRDVNINTDLLSSQGISIIAQRNLNITNGVTVKSGVSYGVTLQAAGGVATATGLLNFYGIVGSGTGNFTLTSGVDSSGNRADLTLDSTNFLMQGAALGTTGITGFRDINVNTGMTAGSFNITITAERDLNIGSSARFKTNSGFTVGLRAAGGNINNIGLLTYNGITDLTLNSRLVLVSGKDLSGNRSDLTIDNTNYIMQGASTGPVSFTGFRDVNLNTDIISSQGITITAERNLTVGTGVTIQSGAPYVTSLYAAGGLISNNGVFTLNGIINASTNSLNIISGIDSVTGLRKDITLDYSNLTMQNVAGVVGLNITGFRDITLNRDIITNYSMNLTAERNLTIASGVTLKTSNGSTILQAAGGNTSNLGTFEFNGVLNSNIGAFTLTSGVDSSGNRNDFTLNNTNFLMQAATVGSLNISGFRDIYLNRDLTSSSNIVAIANRNLTVGSGITIKSGLTNSTTLQAAGGVTTGTGWLNLNGIINAGTGVITLTSGVDSSGNRADLTLDNTNFLMQGATINYPSISGFRDITFNRDLIATGGVFITAYRNLTVSSGVTIAAGYNVGGTYGMFLEAANADANGIGLLTLNGNIITGIGGFKLTSGMDSAGNRADLTLNNSNFTVQGASTAKTDIVGFRDVLLNRNITSSSYLTITASRNLTISPAVALTSNIETVLAAGRFINNSGLGALSVSSGNWFIYSTSPETDTLGGLAYSFRKFGCTYGGGCAPGSGNGFFYSQSGADHDFYTIRSQFQQLPQTVEYTYQTPSVSSINYVGNKMTSASKDNTPFLTIDSALAEQIGIDEGPWLETEAK